jgi:hypothetical protein
LEAKGEREKLDSETNERNQTATFLLASSIPSSSSPLSTSSSSLPLVKGEREDHHS